MARDLSDASRYFNIGPPKLAPAYGIDIKSDHVPSALDKVAGNGASHDAKPDNSNGLVHASPLGNC
jgi:hypothetical protein